MMWRLSHAFPFTLADPEVPVEGGNVRFPNRPAIRGMARQLGPFRLWNLRAAASVCSYTLCHKV